MTPDATTVSGGVKRPAVFSIPPGVSFVDALAAGIRRQAGDDPAALTAVRVLLPTRRAARALSLAFLRQSNGTALLLPGMMPIGDIDDDELILEPGTGDSGDIGLDDLAIPPAIAPLRRQLLLTKLVRAMRSLPTDQAALLARELGRLIDQIHAERLDPHDLQALVPEEFAEHWQQTLRFLTILSDQWPAILADNGAIDAADRRNRLLAAQITAWRRQPPSSPVLVAGSTGSMPATADLIALVATLPQGAVVLPGLDRDADDIAWSAIIDQPSHPQYGMARLLDRLGIDRRDVAEWPERVVSPYAYERALPERIRAIHLAMRPANCAAMVRAAPPIAPFAFDDVNRIDAATPEEEARAIALVMRKTLEVPGRTAALVTPDRTLARRVAGELARWDIAIDDSAGLPLAETPPGVFLRLLARMVAEDFKPVPLLACLKHPLAALGFSVAECRRRTRRLEKRALRGPRPAAGLSGLVDAADDAAANAHAHTGIADDDTDPLVLLAALDRATEPLRLMMMRSAGTDGRRMELAALLAAHVETAERLATSHDEPGARRLWAAEAGEALADFIAEAREAADTITLDDRTTYPELFEILLVGRVVRPRYNRHPRLAIWGPLEARLQHADVMILGSLNEETWPPQVKPSPWMGRPMMKAFGLPLPERRIGLSAHDLAQAFCAPAIYLTRARRREGTPTVRSRWLMRLEALLRPRDDDPPLLANLRKAAEDRWRAAGPWIEWQRRLDTTTIRLSPAKAPAPRPPLSARPRQLSVTQIEVWLRDPYAIFARHILRLRALDPLDGELGPDIYGSFVHQALDLFVQNVPGPMPDDALDRLLAFGRQALGRHIDRPGIRAFWVPKFERIARWLVTLERERDRDVCRRRGELKGSMTLNGPGGAFTLTAQVDRIDQRGDGTLAIIDYKTGALPTKKEIAAGFAPQLPLEAAIGRAGGFADTQAAPVSELEFWKLRGNACGGERRHLADVDQAADRALVILQELIALYDDPMTPYLARPRPDFAPRYSDYEHLERVKEWSAGEAGEADEQ